MSKEFYKKLKNMRIEIGLAQYEMAQKLGVARSTYCMYERGQREPDIETLEAMANIFNVDMNYLLDYSDVHTNTQPTTFNLRRNTPDPEKDKLMDNFVKLNTTGKQKAVEHVEMLTKIPEYQAEQEHIRGDYEKEF